MSERPIAVNDLVMVVRSCSCNYGNGWIGTVESLHTGTWDQVCRCQYCGEEVAQSGETTARFLKEDWPVRWLKRIHPPALPETVEQHEELIA